MLLFRRTILIILIFSVTSCGFQLRQSILQLEKISNVYIETNDPRSVFYRTLKEELISNKVQLAKSKSEAKSVIDIISDETGRRVLSVSARNIATEYEVFYRLIYSYEDQKQMLINSQELVLTRNYTFNEKYVLGKSQEEEVLIEALASDLVRMTLNQISSK
jgi:LPS-assembly lipoprotein